MAKGYAAIHIDSDLHRQFKAVCAEKGTTMSAEIEEILRQYIVHHAVAKMQQETSKTYQLDSRAIALRG